MSGSFSRPGFKALRFATTLAVTGLVLAGMLVGGSYYYLQQEKKNDDTSRKLLSDVSGRLAGANRERDLLKDSAQLFTNLQSQGVFLPEQRLDLIETLEALKSRHKLIGLEYEISPQRALKMADSSSYGQIDINASRIKMKIRAVHDGDLITFLDEFSRMQRGFFPIQSCVMQRKNDAPGDSPSTNIGDVIERVTALGKPAPNANATVATVSAAPLLNPGIDADCALDWITLGEKGADKNAPPATARKP